MTNDANSPAPEPQKGGYGKAGASIFSVIVTNKLAPVFYAMVQHWFPDMAQNVQLDIVDYAQTAIIGGSVYFTPHNFVEAVKSGIIWVKSTLKTWADAWNDSAAK